MTKRPGLGAALVAGLAAAFAGREPLAAQAPVAVDSLTTRTVMPGVVLRRVARPAGPWVIHALAVDLQPSLRAGPAERREGSAQGGAGAGLVVFRPEQARQRVARVATAGDCQVGDERDRLSRVYLDRLAVVLDARRTEQQHRRPRHDYTSR